MSIAVLIYQLIIAGLILYAFNKNKGLGYLITVASIVWTFLNVWFLSPVMFIQFGTIFIAVVIGSGLSENFKKDISH